ncbi:hypothetical protein DZF91_26460 [Actinomadura logoneensis]|uniref:Uncharacterized protein n=1 Tax=Actinomadura logoneensis TaxID=2293572 RepID=A0A372JFJ6_9ACTN|nr:hypothetical protein [Actinomadura logoneensis]RFU38669.1 hypothetical protein DZF91_26460 [Actinomadura logoneensis]
MANSRFPASGGYGSFEAGASDDPGYLASMRPPATVLGQLRLLVSVLLTAPVLILAISPLIVRSGPDGPGGVVAGLLLLPVLVAAVAAVVLGPRAPRPLEPGRDAEEAARLAGGRFRQAIMFRYALTEGTILVGLPLAMIGNTVWIFVFAFAVGYPLLVWLTLPTRNRIEAVRRRLESAGEPSHLWSELLRPLNGG